MDEKTANSLISIIKNTDGVDFAAFGNGTTEEWITKAEERLHFSFPESYRWWLKNYGGGEVFGDEIYSIYELDFDSVIGGDIVYINELNRKNHIINDDQLTICENDTCKWIKDDYGWWFADSTGYYPRDEWRNLPLGSGRAWYAFDARGYMRTGWFDDFGDWYYLSKETGINLGRRLTGWQKIDGQWYYLASTGIMRTGWQKIDSAWYYFEKKGTSTHPQGSMYAGEKTPDGFTVNASGVWVQ